MFFTCVLSVLRLIANAANEYFERRSEGASVGYVQRAFEVPGGPGLAALLTLSQRFGQLKGLMAGHRGP